MFTGRVARPLRELLFAALVLAPLPVWAQATAPAQPAGNGTAADELHIELNKVTDTADGCRAFFVFDNRLDQRLDAFRVDLVLFDARDIIAEQVLIDLAPLRPAKQTVASFVLNTVACDEISRILVNDVPACTTAAGDTLDCLSRLAVSSRSPVALEM